MLIRIQFFNVVTPQQILLTPTKIFLPPTNIISIPNKILDNLPKTKNP